MADRDEATGRQKQFLLDLGCTEAPVGLTRAQASAWISELRDHQAIVATGAKATARADLFTVPPGGSPSPSPAGGQAGGESVGGHVPASSAGASSGSPVPSAPAPQAAGAPSLPIAAAPVSAAVEAAGFRTGAQVLTEQHAPAATFGDLTPEQVRLLKALGRFPDNASPDEITFGLSVAKQLGLSPFRKQIRFIRFGDREPIEPFVTIDGLQAIAGRTGAWAGADLPVWEKDPNDTKRPLSASVTVYRMVGSQRCPFAAIVWWSEFAKKDRSGNLTRSWDQMSFHMLSKVAKAHALRMAFPEELSGVYAEEEAP